VPTASAFHDSGANDNCLQGGPKQLNTANLFQRLSAWKFIHHRDSQLGIVANQVKLLLAVQKAAGLGKGSDTVALNWLGGEQGGVAADSNRPSVAIDRLKPTYVKINTGLANMDDVDVMVTYLDTPYIPNCNDVDNVNGGLDAVAVDTWSNVGARAYWTPQFRPAKKDGAYGFTDTVVTRDLQYDVWNSQVVKHINFQYEGDRDLGGINTYRYRIRDVDFVRRPNYGVFCEGVIDPQCNQKGLLLHQPRYTGANVTCLGAGDIYQQYKHQGRFAVIQNITYVPNNIMLAADPNVEPTYLHVFEDLEPVSGALVRGSLKLQVSLVVPYWIGASRQALGAYKTNYTTGNTFVDNKNVLGFQCFTAEGWGANGACAAVTMNPAPTVDAGATAVESMVWPLYWSNKNGAATKKNIDDLKFAHGAVTASRLVLIIGTIVGGVMFFVFLVLFLIYLKAWRADGGRQKLTSSAELATHGGTSAAL